ncbi:MAG TPA: FAD/NAD(P)-binding protein [Acidobacteriota bacterium]|nr:FAD/NAD(P)-binding protein [Acidobacteriota bacterium]
MKKSDHDLGMGHDITRRDFLNGAGVAIGSAGALGTGLGGSPANAVAAPVNGPQRPGAFGADEYYPPKLTGMRGSHPGSFEVAHEMRYGKTWDEAEETGETYDMIIVGGGLSGLAAAYYFRKALPESKVLVLDNHDDFGGHAKRNEYMVGDRQVIGYGGTMFITGAYTPEGVALFDDIGLDTERFHAANPGGPSIVGTYGLQAGVFFDRETFGDDRLVVGTPSGGFGMGDAGVTWTEFLQQTPLNPQAQKDMARLYDDSRDYLPELSVEEKVKRLRSMSYKQYLLDVVGVDPQVAVYLHHSIDHNGAAGIDSISAWGAFRSGWVPGFDGLGLEMPSRNWWEKAGIDNPFEGIHFPDGNAGVARLMVRWLIPESLPGSTMEDSVAARVRYEALDRPENDVRIRLNSTVVSARHSGDPRSADDVQVTYVQDGKAYRARAATCVMACYNAVVPYLCPEIPDAQRAALQLAVRKPYVYTNVLVRNWTAFHELGVSNISCPGSFHESILLDWRTNLGDYKAPSNPEEPMVIHLSRTPKAPGLPARDQFRAAREELLATSFETFERNVRDQLGRALANGGFDPARDIEAITVNRWPHGYAGAPNDLYDPEWAYDEPPFVVGRKRFGRITIANSDAAAVSLTSAAFDQAHRAVQELLTDVIRPEFQYPWAERT